MNVSIFGLGYVGCISLGCFAQMGHKVIGVDVNSNKINLINSGKATIVEKDIDRIISEQFSIGNISATENLEEAILNSEISMITVGTPLSENGHLDLSYIFKVVEDIAKILKQKNEFHIIAIRSTVIPGTIKQIVDIIENISGKINNEDFAVLSNPEFLREGSSVDDFYNPPYILVGTDNSKAFKMIEKLYDGINSEIILSTIEEAEIIKSINNTFHALKVSFANEVGNICKELNINSRRVMEIFVKDTQLNISPYYLKPGFAYGGSCLPKDLKSLQTLAHDKYLDIPLVNSIDKSNDQQIDRCFKLISKLNKKKIGVLGLSFKEGTDDLRNSPIVMVIELLIGKGYELKIFDENVRYSQLTGRNKEYIDSHIPHIANLIVEPISEVLDFADLLIISVYENKFKQIAKTTNKLVLDLVGIDDTLNQRPNYFGINW